MPAGQRLLYPNPKHKKERYANSIRISDEYFGQFIQDLKKEKILDETLLIVVGDHSFPVGEHGNYDSSRLFFNENFKTPLLIVWPKVIKPQLIKQSYSQVDIVPTLLDLLEIKTNYLGWGVSMLKKEKPSIHLIQPYSGGYIVSIRDKLKYVYHVRRHKEFLFDLSVDPNEEHNIINQMTDKLIINSFKEDIQRVFYNDSLIERNMAFPHKLWAQSNK